MAAKRERVYQGGAKRESRSSQERRGDSATSEAANVGSSPTASTTGPSPAKKAVIEKVREDMDEILESIDSVLEANAEEFVSSYVQRGGE